MPCETWMMRGVLGGSDAVVVQCFFFLSLQLCQCNPFHLNSWVPRKLENCRKLKFSPSLPCWENCSVGNSAVSNGDEVMTMPRPRS